MKKRLFAFVMASVLSTSIFAGCGNSAVQDDQSVQENQNLQEESTDEELENGAAETESTEDLSDLEALGDVEVDAGLFNVTLTIPQDFVGDTTQEELDEQAKENGYKSATLNEDGSVTYVMTKAQHKEMLEGIAQSINDSFAEMVGSEDYPNITSITANDNFTSFTIVTKNEEPDFAESFAVMGMYVYGGMYAIFSGEEADNIHVDYVNDATGEVISSADSSDMDN